MLDLTVDVRDAVGDRLHISDEFNKDGVRLLTPFQASLTQNHRLHSKSAKHNDSSTSLPSPHLTLR